VTPLRSKLRNLLERLLKRFYEGPHPPPRIREEARLFDLLNPGASPEEWEEFAVRFAENCYRDGFVRGFEQSERDPDRIEPTPDEAILHAQRHDWSLAAEQGRVARLLREGVDPADPMPGATPEERAAWLEEQAAIWGGYKVIALDPEGHPLREVSDRSDTISEEDEG
jgi:hypothetical protein